MDEVAEQPLDVGLAHRTRMEMLALCRRTHHPMTNRHRVVAERQVRRMLAEDEAAVERLIVGIEAMRAWLERRAIDKA